MEDKNAAIVDPAHDLVDISRYQLSTPRKCLTLPFVSSMTKRGRPYRCTYCQTPSMFGEPVRSRSPGRVKQELRTASLSLAAKSVLFWDDTFTYSRERMLELCEGIGGLSLQMDV